MKSPTHAQSTTSLPRAPRDAVSARSTRYLITMGIRVACFILMVVITPYGWYTWVFGAGAIFLPYIAVVFANVAPDEHQEPERPARALESSSTTTEPVGDTTVIQLHETRQVPPPQTPDERA